MPPRRCARCCRCSKQKDEPTWRKRIGKNVKEWWKTLEERAHGLGQSGQPAAGHLGTVAAPAGRVILTSDSGSCANWYARDLKIRRGMMASLSGGLASMGAAVPYAIAAKFAHPDRPVIALVGDGAMQMNNMAELITVAKYWRNGPIIAGSSASSTTRISIRSPGSSG